MENKQDIVVGCSYCGAKNRIPVSRTGERAVCGRCKKALSLQARYPDYPVTISDQTFDKEVIKFPGPVVVYYWGSWCPYCPTLTAMVDQMAKEYSGKLKFTKLILEQNPVTGSQYDVQSVPTLLLFKNGRQVTRIVGSQPRREVERQLQAIL